MEISRHWRLQQQRYGLVGEICPHCEEKIFPPRDICPECGARTKNEHGEALIPYRFSGKGEVYSHTTVYDAPEGFEAPYTEVLVKLEEGPLVTVPLTDPEWEEVEEIIDGEPRKVLHRKIKIGDKGELVTRKWTEDPAPDGDRDKGMIIYGPKIRLF